MVPRRSNAEEGSAALVPRLTVAIVGGYVFASGAAASLADLLAAARIPRAHAAEAAALVGLIVYFAAALVAFGAWPLRWVAAILLCGGGGLLGLAAALA